MKITEQLRTVQMALKAPKGQHNKFGNYDYRSCEDILEAVKPLLQKESLTLTLDDEVVSVGNRIYVKTTATVRNENGELAENHAFARESETKKGMDDSQITGTASSYARKYALNGLFLIDDTKDADTDEYAALQEKEKQNVTCECCGKKIKEAESSKGKKWTPAATAHFTKEKSGKVMCFDCYHKFLNDRGTNHA